MSWSTVLEQVVGAAIGAAVPLCGFVFWLGKISAELSATMKKCEGRERDHSHHYEKINDHSIRLENHERRITVLERPQGGV